MVQLPINLVFHGSQIPQQLANRHNINIDLFQVKEVAFKEIIRYGENVCDSQITGD